MVGDLQSHEVFVEFVSIVISKHSIMTLPRCASDAVWSGGYWTYVTANGILILLQSTLLAHTIYHHHSYRNNKRFTKFGIMLTIYIAMQCLALLWLLMDMLMYSIDPHTFILRNSFLCKAMAYGVYYIPPIFYGLYLYQIILRLET